MTPTELRELAEWHREQARLLGLAFEEEQRKGDSSGLGEDESHHTRTYKALTEYAEVLERVHGKYRFEQGGLRDNFEVMWFEDDSRIGERAICDRLNQLATAQQPRTEHPTCETCKHMGSTHLIGRGGLGAHTLHKCRGRKSFHRGRPITPSTDYCNHHSALSSILQPKETQ